MPRLESHFYNELRRKVTWPWIQRIENAIGDRGVPDIEFIGYRCRGWIELKRQMLRPDSVVELRKEQVAWHLAYAQAGGSSWVALSAGGSYFLWAGAHVRALKKAPLKETAEIAEVWGSKKEFYEHLATF